MKKARNIILVSLILVVALLNAIVFLTIPDGRTDTTAFWLAWAFAVPINLIIAILLHLWSGKKGSVDMINMPIAYYLIGVFGVIYLIVGAIFMYLPITKIVLLIILESVTTVAYIIVAMYFLFGASYMVKSKQYTKEKVLYIKMLLADINDCVSKANDAEVVNALNKFAEDVRFSDPMTHSSLAMIEGQLSQTVADISVKLDTGDVQEVLALIKKGESQLESRNKRCIMLK